MTGCTRLWNRHLKMTLAQADVFINVVGGLKLIEPAADLPVAAALISTESGVEVGAKTCFFGEIGLTGEVRAVPFADQRLREAEKLGFKTIFVSKYNLKGIDVKKYKIEIRGVAKLDEAFRGIF